MGCLTVLINFGDGTHGATIMSWYQHLLHHKATLSLPEEQGEREDPQPDSFTAVGWADCPGSYVSINIEGPEESFFDQQQDSDAAAPPAAGGAIGEEQQQEQYKEQQQEHHPVIQELVAHTH